MQGPETLPDLQPDFTRVATPLSGGPRSVEGDGENFTKLSPLTTSDVKGVNGRSWLSRVTSERKAGSSGTAHVFGRLFRRDMKVVLNTVFWQHSEHSPWAIQPHFTDGET